MLRHGGSFGGRNKDSALNERASLFAAYLTAAEISARDEIAQLSKRMVRRRAFLTDALASIERVRAALARHPEAVDLAFAVLEMQALIFADDMFTGIAVSKVRRDASRAPRPNRTKEKLERHEAIRLAGARIKVEHPRLKNSAIAKRIVMRRENHGLSTDSIRKILATKLRSAPRFQSHN